MFGDISRCDRCERRPATIARDDGDVWCIDCVDNDNEAAWERQQVADFESYHGGTLVTLAERMDDAYRQKREGRR